MKLQIEQPYVDAMLQQFPELGTLAEQLRFGNKALFDVPGDGLLNDRQR